MRAGFREYNNLKSVQSRHAVRNGAAQAGSGRLKVVGHSVISTACRFGAATSVGEQRGLCREPIPANPNCRRGFRRRDRTLMEELFEYFDNRVGVSSSMEMAGR